MPIDQIRPSHAAVLELELALCRLHQRSQCVLVSSGTVGLALTLRALGLENAGIAIPSGVCLNVPLAAKYAGATPIYCDIDPGTLGLSPATLSAAEVPFNAVLAVHAYGNVCDIGSLASYCKASSIPLIEDVAVAQGATVDGRPAGSFGEASILSFGRGKIVDVGGGGAMLTDDAALASEVRKGYRRLPLRGDADEKRLDAFNSCHTRLYNQHYGIDLGRHVAPFIEMALALREATLTRSDWDQEAAARELAILAGNLARRRALSEYLFTKLESRVPPVRCHRSLQGSVPWRAGVFVPGHRNRILRALLAERVKISSWYPPAQEFLEPIWKGDTPVARRVGDEILNVWVNGEVDTRYLDKVIERIIALTCSAEATAWPTAGASSA